MNVTLKMVAQEAGVSLATASAAMRGLDIVKSSTRKKVEDAAEKLNYRRNSAAAVLSSHRNRNSQKQAYVVWLSAYPPSAQHGTGWNTGIRYALKEAPKLGLKIEHYNIDYPEDTLRIMREIEARGCDGIIAEFSAYPNLPAIPWNRFSVVSTDESRLKDGFDVVLPNHFRSTLSLLRRIQQAGYKRIGICLREHAPLLHPDDEMRYGATAAFQLYNQTSRDRIPVIRIPHEAPDIAARLVKWVEKYKPEVVLGFGAETKSRIESNGYKIPENMSYVSLHVSEPDHGIIAGLQHNKEVVPAYALRVLLEKMRRGIRGLPPHPQETEIIPPLLAGDSCPGLVGDVVD